MALLVRPIKVDLGQTPVLCWQWRIDTVVPGGDIHTKRGNDFAARVYVGFDMPASALSGSAKMKLSIARSVLGMDVPDAALTYVWDNKSPVGVAVRSPFSDRQQLIVTESGKRSTTSRAGRSRSPSRPTATTAGRSGGRPSPTSISSGATSNASPDSCSGE
jgi:hypothetical protein